jgi:hypothetical protein
MAADRQRLAAALAYEEERRRRMMESVPTTDNLPPVQPSRRSLRTDLENFSAGLGQAGVNALEGTKALITDPVGTVKGAYESVRQMVRDPSLIADALRYTADKAMSGPLGAGEVIGEMVNPMRIRGKPPIAEIDVYHGSPHVFDEFDASKIGTGEGAQAYGHGIYFAEKPDVARSYQFKRLTGDIKFDDGTQINVLKLPKNSPEKLAAQLWLTNPNLEEATQFVKSVDQKKWAGTNPEWAVPKERVLEELKKLNQKGAKLGGGAFYQADLPDEMVDRMLDWDKPLKEQPAAVREAFQDIMQSNLWDEDTRKLISGVGIEADEITGKKLYELLASSDELAGKGRFGKAASEELARRGVPGIRYLDAGSRGQGSSGTRNFVVFPGEEKKVKILKRE